MQEKPAEGAPPYFFDLPIPHHLTSFKTSNPSIANKKHLPSIKSTPQPIGYDCPYRD